MPPDINDRRPRAESGDHDGHDGGNVNTSVTGAVARGPQCAWCHRPLPRGRRRFCSDDHRRRGQKRERVIEDDNYAAGVMRLVRAQYKRAGADLAMFALFAESVDYARARLAEAAAQLIAQGYSYSDIARELCITRQAAWKRFGRQPKVGTGTAGTAGAA